MQLHTRRSFSSISRFLWRAPLSVLANFAFLSYRPSRVYFPSSPIHCRRRLLTTGNVLILAVVVGRRLELRVELKLAKPEPLAPLQP